MKTYILQLEQHDDIISVRDKMGWAKNSRILIVWPEHGDILNRRLDLKLLQRHGQSLGSAVALITKDPEIRYYAPRMGIPVYKSVRNAQNQSWRVPYRFRKSLPIERSDLQNSAAKNPTTSFSDGPDLEIKELSPVRRAAAFAAGILALLALSAVLMPRSTIYIHPKTLVQDVLIEASTNPEIQKINLTGSVPSVQVEEIVEGRDSELVSGSVFLPDQPAEGVAIFTNLTDQEIEIPKGIVVRPATGQSLRYATTEKMVVPAGFEKTAQASIICLIPGENGNLPAGSLAILEGIYGTFLGVTNPEPITGGSDRLEPAPSSKDRELLADRLQKSLAEAAFQEIQAKLGPGDILIPSSLELIETLEQNFQPDESQPGDLLSLSMRLKYQARVVRAAELEKLTQTVFDANLPKGYTPIQGSLQVEIAEAPTSNNTSSPTWKLHAVRRIQAQISESKAIQLSLGLAPRNAISQLQTILPLEEAPTISLQPEWWPRMPILPFQIRVQYHNINDIIE